MGPNLSKNIGEIGFLIQTKKKGFMGSKLAYFWGNPRLVKNDQIVLKFGMWVS